MRAQRLALFTGALVAGAAGAACQPAADSAAFSDADHAAVTAVTEAWASAVRAGDADAVSSLYTDDTHFMPPNQPPIHGRDAVHEWFAGLPPIAEVTLLNGRVEGSGDIAYVYGTYTLRFDMEGAPTDSGSYFDVRVRQADGSWKFAADMFHSDLPVPSAGGE